MKKMKFILDTDMGSDCDDVGALSLLHSLSKKYDHDILAVTHCASEISGAVTIRVINEFFGKGSIPVGRYTAKPFLEEDHCKKYTSVIMSDYLQTHDMPTFENATRVMRRCLSENREVTLISIGMLNNYAELLESTPDDISPLTGVELIKQSATELYVMGGNFADFNMSEYNIKCDVQSAQKVSLGFPVPIVYCGFELGYKVFTGECFKADDNPMGKAYSIYSTNGTRESWDPVTVYCAIERSTELYELCGNKTITFTDDGRAVLRDGGKDSYVIAKAPAKEIEQVLENHMYI